MKNQNPTVVSSPQDQCGSLSGNAGSAAFAFPVGSRVKIIAADPECPADFIGSEGTVVRIAPADENCSDDMYSVRTDSGKQDGFFSDELISLPNQ
jgi:hypothetical protein